MEVVTGGSGWLRDIRAAPGCLLVEPCAPADGISTERMVAITVLTSAKFPMPAADISALSNSPPAVTNNRHNFFRVSSS